MSFEKFEPARAEELQSPETNQSVDGAQVGGKNEFSDTADKKGEDKRYEKIMPSIEDTAIKQKEGGDKLNQFAQENPDVLSKKEQGPEAIKQAGLEMNDKWPL